MTENIIPGHYQVFMNVMQMYTKEHLALFLIWQCFQGNLTYHISLISYYLSLIIIENTSFWNVSGDPLGNSQNSSKSTDFI